MEETKNVERLASLEAEMRGIKEVVIKLDGKFDAWSQNFPSRMEVKEMLVSRDQRLDRIEQELTRIEQDREQEKQSNKNAWPAWVAVAIAALALLYSAWPHK